MEAYPVSLFGGAKRFPAVRMCTKGLGSGDEARHVLYSETSIILTWNLGSAWEINEIHCISGGC